VLIALVISVLQPTRFEATGQMTVSFEQGPTSGLAAVAEAAGVADPTKLQTQVSILQTDSIAWDVIKRLRLDQQAAALPFRFGFGVKQCQTPAGLSIDAVDRVCQRKLLNEFRERLHVQALPRTEIIEIRYRSGSPELAAQVINTLAAIYVERGLESDYKSSSRSGDWLTGQLVNLRKEAQDAEARMIEFQRTSGLLATDGPQSMQLTALNGLNQQLVTARAQRIAQEARYHTALLGDPEAMVGVAQGSTLQVLHAEEVSLSNQYAQLQIKFGDSYPRVIQLKEQLDKAKADTRAELEHTREKIRLELEAAKTSESLLQSMFTTQKQQIFDSSEAVVKLAMLRRDVDSSNELYDQVLWKSRLGEVTAGINRRDVALIDPPMVPVQRAEPHRAMNIIAGLFIGLFCGLALCAVLEGQDGRIGTIRLLDRVCPLKGVNIIPNLSGRERSAQGKLSLIENSLNRVAALDFPASETANAYRAVRSALLHSEATGAVPKVILITSPRGGEGKTALSTNLAVVIAQTKRRVALIDADLHGFGFTSVLHATRNPGLAGLLMHRGSEPTFIEQPGLPALMILPAGVPDRQPADLLESDRMREFLNRWRADFDHIIVEAPHVLDLSDAMILATMTDTVVLNLRVGHGRRADLNRVLEIFSFVKARVSGAVACTHRVGSTGVYKQKQVWREREGEAG
jgi:capsular exopolysaccharide synthesis family protein